MLVDANGRHVSVTVHGNGDPTTVFVAALGEPGRNWTRVQQHLGDHLRQVTYDRAGIGDSPPRMDSTAPQPYSSFAAELTSVLDALDATSPIILVSHSFGSLIVRAFTATHPERVAGLVHVDGSVPQLALLPAVGYPYKTDGDHPQATRIDSGAGAAQIHAAPPPPCVPAIVLTKTPGHWGDPRYTDEIDVHWQETQAALAEELHAVHIIAVDAGHRLQEETPELVAYAVETVAAAARAGAVLATDEAKVGRYGGRLA